MAVRTKKQNGTEGNDHEHNHDGALGSAFKGKLGDLLDEYDVESFLEAYEQFKALVPVGEGLWKVGRKDVSRVAGLLLDVANDLAEDLQPSLARGHSLDAKRRKSYLEALVLEGFERQEAMQILLAQLKPLNLNGTGQSISKATTEAINKSRK
ncbi:MAG: hypothetical protein UW30_C0005G0034 [Candidatus Giovannonibacteria bacterium GW2011_GWA2_44_13b]|uniref:Uncharacterized protein n=2 Tax=Candidatus Giovannoniibacteriota TaxID=1752738 RepID=A0A0G1H4N3_9BACT|nr:MAG: hypothetical protein UW30_C0005G0034 [Candidatus Giovannonibacteria bacterium GW2011_GWA2_44_13b]OGF81530.1 MAG: hypothetical protein A2924_03380 [Candidatus Giovannonibacteria bacterium RIFCSPLOWO2_01_FULL_44_16]